MARSRQAQLALAAVTGTLLMAFAVPAPAEAAGRCGAGSSRPRPVVIRTVPVLPKAVIRLDGRPLKGDGRGSFSGAFGCAEDIRKHLTTTAVVPLKPGVRQRFVRWATAVRGSELIAVYDVERLVSFRFYRLDGEPVPLAEIDEFVVKSSTGAVLHRQAESFWVQSERVVTTPDGPRVKKLFYTIETVRVDSTEVVRRSQQRFIPAERNAVRVELLYFPIQVRTHDTLFRFSIGSAVLLTHPDGRVTRHRLQPDGRLTVPALPRGQYSLRLEAAAPTVTHPLTLSRPQEVDLAVMSWLDIGVLMTVLLLVAALLVVARRPHLRLHRSRRADSRPAALVPSAPPEPQSAAPALPEPVWTPPVWTPLVWASPVPVQYASTLVARIDAALLAPVPARAGLSPSDVMLLNATPLYAALMVSRPVGSGPPVATLDSFGLEAARQEVSP